MQIPFFIFIFIFILFFFSPSCFHLLNTHVTFVSIFFFLLLFFFFILFLLTPSRKGEFATSTLKWDTAQLYCMYLGRDVV